MQLLWGLMQLCDRRKIAAAAVQWYSACVPAFTEGACLTAGRSSDGDS